MIVEASSQKAHESTPKSYWFVGAAYGGIEINLTGS